MPTTLSPSQEALYRAWMQRIGQTQAAGQNVDSSFTGGDYDYRGFFKKYGAAQKGQGEHFTDEFKLPNHETFSDESIYATGANRLRAGHWNGDNYVPASMNQMPMQYDPSVFNPQIAQQMGVNQQPNFSWQSRLANGAQSFLGNRDLALALLANSGPSTQKRSFGQILGGSMLQADQAKQQRADEEFKRAYMTAQMQNMGQQRQAPSVQEYEYAKQNGYTGTFPDWVKMGGQTSRPSSVQEWEFYNALPDDQKRLYLEMKRNPNFKVQEVNGAQNVIQGGPGGAVNVTPLSTTQSEIAAAAARKQAESQAGAVGTGTGNIIAGIQKKGADSQTVNSVLDIADPLIDAATGSAVGAGADKLASVFGQAPKGAQAIAQLQVLQAGLMLNMPRMEGPQSDRDVELYRQAAASLGDATVPREIKKAAVTTIRQLQQKYADRAKQPFQLAPGTTPQPAPTNNTVNWSDLK